MTVAVAVPVLVAVSAALVVEAASLDSPFDSLEHGIFVAATAQRQLAGLVRALNIMEVEAREPIDGRDDLGAAVAAVHSLDVDFDLRVPCVATSMVVFVRHCFYLVECGADVGSRR